MKSIGAMLFEKMLTYGNHQAISFNGRSISYSELIEKSLAVATFLTEAGAKNELIGVVGQRTPSSCMAVLGSLFAGCGYVPINPKYNPDRLFNILSDSKVRFLVGDKKSLTQLDSTLQQSSLKQIKAIILPEEQASAGSGWIDRDEINALSFLAHPIGAGQNDLAYLLYTSGSTGLPKGVQVTNANLIAFLENMDKIFSVEMGFRSSQTFDLSFDLSVSDMFFTWNNGGVLCLLSEDELSLPSEYILRERITFWSSVPTLAKFLYKMGCLEHGSFPELAYATFCGEPLPMYLANAWRKAAPNSAIYNLYGPTEATIYISHHCYQKHEENRDYKNSIVPIGSAFPGHTIKIIDESDNPVEQGGVGQIIFKGPQITLGYLNDAEKTAKSFTSFEWDESGERWYRSGDLGVLNDDGNLECLGRLDGQIKLGGRRIELGEIEAVLNRYPATLNSVVVAAKDSCNVVIGCVAFIANKISAEEESFIRIDSTKYLERIFFPKKIICLDELPLTSSGKVNRKILANMAHEQF